MNNFPKRLAQACRSNSEIPEYGRGQQVFIATKLGVSQEAVRKWFAGESTPRRRMGERLATLLGVKYAWLMLGSTQGEITAGVKAAKRHEASTYSLMAQIIGKKSTATFDTGMDQSDLLMIKDGRQLHISTEFSEPDENGVYKASFSAEQIDATLTVACVVIYDDKHSVSADFIEIPADIWEAHGTQNGSDIEIRFQKKPRTFTYYVGDTKLNKFME